MLGGDWGAELGLGCQNAASLSDGSVDYEGTALFPDFEGCSVDQVDVIEHGSAADNSAVIGAILRPTCGLRCRW